jgi:methyl-accepting chemotaxis protein
MIRLDRYSLRTKLSASLAVLLASISAFLVLFFPARMDAVARRWAESRAVGMSALLANAVAPGLEFDDPADAGKALAALTLTPEAVYGVVRRTNGAVLAAYKPEAVPATAAKPGEGPLLTIEGGLLHVSVQVRTKSGDAGVLSIGFTLASLEKERRSNLLVVAAVSALVLALGIGVTLAVGTLLARPLQDLSKVALCIASGDLKGAEEALGGAEQVRTMAVSGAVEAGSGSDEVHLLGRAFATMLNALRETSTMLQESARLLQQSVTNLSSTAADQSKLINFQASALEETRVTAQEIKQTSVTAAEKAQAVITAAERADEIQKSGDASINQTIDGLGDLRGQVEQIAKQMAALTERTQQIGRITETVKDLADQSNMLALNAAIEAVRSGEHGKGFAVVAREIRSLADQSIQATTRVRDVLGDIQGAIHAAAESSEKGSERMESGLAQVRVSGENMRELSTIVSSNFAAARQIAATVGQQNVGIAQIFAAMGDLTKMMDDTQHRMETSNQAISVVKEVSQRVLEVATRYRI